MADLSLVYGESRILDIAVTDAAGAVVNITGSSLYLAVKADWLDADAAILFELTIGSGITVTDAPNGIAEAKVTPASWSGITNEPGRLVWDLTEKDSSNDVWRLDDGRLLVQMAAKETIT